MERRNARYYVGLLSAASRSTPASILRCWNSRDVRSRSSRGWYSGRAEIGTFELDELLATKLRALYQRRKGRDLFDLAMGLADGRSDAGRIAAAFREYMDREGAPVTRAMFERNLAGKIGDAQFNADMSALLRPGFEWRPEEAARTVSERLISLLPGEPWKGETDGLRGR